MSVSQDNSQNILCNPITFQSDLFHSETSGKTYIHVLPFQVMLDLRFLIQKINLQGDNLIEAAPLILRFLDDH